MKLPWSRRSRGRLPVVGALTDSRTRKSLLHVGRHLVTHPKLLGSLLVLVSRFARRPRVGGKDPGRATKKLLGRASFSKTRRALERVLH